MLGLYFIISGLLLLLNVTSWGCQSSLCLNRRQQTFFFFFDIACITDSMTELFCSFTFTSKSSLGFSAEELWWHVNIFSVAAVEGVILVCFVHHLRIQEYDLKQKFQLQIYPVGIESSEMCLARCVKSGGDWCSALSRCLTVAVQTFCHLWGGRKFLYKAARGMLYLGYGRGRPSFCGRLRQTNTSSLCRFHYSMSSDTGNTTQRCRRATADSCMLLIHGHGFWAPQCLFRGQYLLFQLEDASGTHANMGLDPLSGDPSHYGLEYPSPGHRWKCCAWVIQS